MKNKIEVFSDENYIIIIGDCTKKQAGQALRKTEKEEWGIEESEFFDLRELYSVNMRETVKDGDDGWDWGEKEDCTECGTKLVYPIKGWIGNL